jgi:hypothetical protein
LRLALSEHGHSIRTIKTTRLCCSLVGCSLFFFRSRRGLPNISYHADHRVNDQSQPADE